MLPTYQTSQLVLWWIFETWLILRLNVCQIFNTIDVYPSMNRRRNCDFLSKFCQIFVKTKRDVVAHFHAAIMEVYLSFNLSETQFQNPECKHLFCTCLNKNVRSPICGTVIDKLSVFLTFFFWAVLRNIVPFL